MNNSEYRLRCDMDVCAENELRYCNTATADIRWALAEIDRLRAELAQTSDEVAEQVQQAIRYRDAHELAMHELGQEKGTVAQLRAELAQARAAVWHEAAEIAERKPKPHMDAATAREIAAELRGHAEQAALRAGHDALVRAPEGLGGASNAE